jgi:hypothetical protein
MATIFTESWEEPLFDLVNTLNTYQLEGKSFKGF